MSGGSVVAQPLARSGASAIRARRCISKMPLSNIEKRENAIHPTRLRLRLGNRRSKSGDSAPGGANPQLLGGRRAGTISPGRSATSGITTHTGLA